MIAELHRWSGELDAAIALVLPLGADNPALMRITAVWLEEAGRLDEAVDFYRRAAEHGDVSALRQAVSHLKATSRTDEAIEWLRSRAEKGDSAALDQAVWLSLSAERTDNMLEWLYRQAGKGDAEALRQLAIMLHDMGRTSDAIYAYQKFQGDIGP